MKKLITMGLLVAFTAACTHTSVEEAYETEIQLIDKEDVLPPGERVKKRD